ncbi:MAG: hypothetical protein ACJ75S_07175 [Solirubrobacterales bacterium]|jgi:hypothetical protein
MRQPYHLSGRKKRVASFPTTLSFEGFARSPLLEAIALSLLFCHDRRRSTAVLTPPFVGLLIRSIRAADLFQNPRPGTARAE